MNHDRRSSPNDPSNEPAVGQSAQSASGLSSGREGPGVPRNQALETVNRNRGNTTPRRYDQPIEEDASGVMPADDSTLNTKM
jgi:hypothetical protein